MAADSDESTHSSVHGVRDVDKKREKSLCEKRGEEKEERNERDFLEEKFEKRVVTLFCEKINLTKNFSKILRCLPNDSAKALAC
jgi:hypothetical protein